MARRPKSKICWLKKAMPTKPKPCHLLKLPNSVLTSIYRFSLGHFTIDMEKVNSNESFLHPLMATCKKVRMTMRPSQIEYLKEEASKTRAQVQEVHYRIIDNIQQGNMAPQHRWRDFVEHAQLLNYEIEERKWEFRKVARMAVTLEEEADEEAWKEQKWWERVTKA